MPRARRAHLEPGRIFRLLAAHTRTCVQPSGTRRTSRPGIIARQRMAKVLLAAYVVCRAERPRQIRTLRRAATLRFCIMALPPDPDDCP